MNNQEKLKRILIAVIVVIYILNPVDFPGPIDDIIVTIVGAALEVNLSKKNNKNKKDSE
ncbi:MAG: hypothetical protein ACI4KB_11785 [Oscillospiraceae bacterium]|nr:hypothetical protein [Oscillospiraceae bacterium]